MDAGQYPRLLQRKIRSITKDSSTGQDEESFSNGAYYWCRVEIPNSRRQTDYGASQTGADVTIYVRNLVTLSALDRLYDSGLSKTYIIESIRQGDNELICEGNYFDTLVV